MARVQGWRGASGAPDPGDRLGTGVGRNGEFSFVSLKQHVLQDVGVSVPGNQGQDSGQLVEDSAFSGGRRNVQKYTRKGGAQRSAHRGVSCEGRAQAERGHVFSEATRQPRGDSAGGCSGVSRFACR